MNILVLGNGFDLAHGLPTKYTDFLKFIENIKRIDISKEKMIDLTDMDLQFKDMIIEKTVKNQKSYIKELIELIENNIWINYFLQNQIYQKENWIDFENEISIVIQVLDEARKSTQYGDGVYDLPDSNFFLINNIVNAFNSNIGTVFNSVRAIDEFISVLEIDLKKLIRALEIYLENYVKMVHIKKESPDIMFLDIDRVLNFNYSDTYQRIYGINKQIEYDYIHGKANINNTIESNNMVLGVDEYLDEERKNKDVEFIGFKKFYQRIHKETGCKYKEWVDEIKKEYSDYLEYKERSKHEKVPLHERKTSSIHNLYIFGHSLNVTDKDILKDLILIDNVHTTIYYVNKKVYGQQIANLVKVIGQDELIKRTGGSTKTITFKLQEDMVEKS